MCVKKISMLIVSALLAPVVCLFLPDFFLSLLTQICIAVLICASLRLLVGSGGILNFGQMLYVGIGAYIAAHVVSASPITIPLLLVPLLSGVVTLLIAIPTGWLCIRRSNRIYMAMVSLALCELTYALAQVWPQAFGDEMGLQFDRTASNFWGLDFADARWGAVIALVYMAVLLCLLYQYTRTPAGRWLEAARDDEVLVQSLGMNPQRLRLMAFMVSSFTCGVAGGLLAIDLESVNASLFSVSMSGEYLIFTYLGGLSSLLGAAMGGVLMQISNLWLPMLTPAWQLYLGLLFVYMVINWPDGFAGCLWVLFRKNCAGTDVAYQFRAGRFFVAAFGIVCLTEAVYRLWGADVTYNTSAVSPLWVGVGLGGLFLLLFLVLYAFIKGRRHKVGGSERTRWCVKS